MGASGAMSGSYRRRREPPPVAFPIADHVQIDGCADPDDHGPHAHVTLYLKGEAIAGFTLDKELFDYVVERCREIFKQPGLGRMH